MTRSGWTAGGGFEQAFAGGWSWFAEYNYLNFGTNTVTFATNTVPSATFPIDVQQDMHMIVVGVNYRFSTGPLLIERSLLPKSPGSAGAFLPIAQPRDVASGPAAGRKVANCGRRM